MKEKYDIRGKREKVLWTFYPLIYVTQLEKAILPNVFPIA
jgi:hypothetical protein